MPNQTSQEMYPLIAEWEKSGKSQKAFCEAVQLKLHVFKYWVKKRNKEERRDARTSNFIALEIEQPAASSKSSPLFAEIAYPSGAALRLYQPLNSEALQVLVQGIS